MGSLPVVLSGAVAGCSVEELGDAVDSTPGLELGASDVASNVAVLGAGIAGASVGVVGAVVLLMVGVIVLGGSVEVGLGNCVELSCSVEVEGAAVLIGGGGLQGKG